MNIQAYYRLTKPGIIYGNMLTAIAGFFLASKWHIHFWLLLATLLGMSLVIACGCVINNYIDRGIDSKMKRTKKRALVSGVISPNKALVFGFTLGAVGLTLLSLYVNPLTAFLGILALFDYVVLYGITKRRSSLGTLVGSVAGALPPVAGYTAFTNHLDGGAIVLFLILVCWQMPHFYAIAIRRQEEYALAKIPVLPIVKGFDATKTQIQFYIAAFLIASSLLTVLGYTGYVYMVGVLAIGIIWFWKSVKRPHGAQDNIAWSRNMFLFSLVCLLSISVLISVGGILP